MYHKDVHFSMVGGVREDGVGTQGHRGQKVALPEGQKRLKEEVARSECQW